MSDVQPFVLSFVWNDELHTWNFRCSSLEATILADKLKTALKGEVQDLQVYPPINEPETLTSAFIAIAEEAPSSDDTLISRAEELAAPFDIEREGRTPHVIEFVWNNGGGDDNAFGTTVLLHDDEVDQALASLMHLVPDDAYAYQIVPVPDHDTTLREVLPDVERMVNGIIGYDPDGENDPEIARRHKVLSNWIDEIMVQAPHP